MYALFLIFCGLVVALLALAAREYVAHKWASYRDAAPVSFADVRALPETTVFDPKPDLPRERLRSVPVRPDLRLVSDLPAADDSWLEELLAADPLQIPEQRKPSDAS